MARPTGVQLKWETKLRVSRVISRPIVTIILCETHYCHAFWEIPFCYGAITALTRRVFIPIIKFRTCNYKLPIETGRWHDVPYIERKCTLRNRNELGDDFHYLMKCSFFETERKELLRPYYYNRPNIIKF